MVEDTGEGIKKGGVSKFFHGPELDFSRRVTRETHRVQGPEKSKEERRVQV